MAFILDFSDDVMGLAAAPAPHLPASEPRNSITGAAPPTHNASSPSAAGSANGGSSFFFATPRAPADSADPFRWDDDTPASDAPADAGPGAVDELQPPCDPPAAAADDTNDNAVGCADAATQPPEPDQAPPAQPEVQAPPQAPAPIVLVAAAPPGPVIALHATKMSAAKTPPSPVERAATTAAPSPAAGPSSEARPPPPCPHPARTPATPAQRLFGSAASIEPSPSANPAGQQLAAAIHQAEAFTADVARLLAEPAALREPEVADTAFACISASTVQSAQHVTDRLAGARADYCVAMARIMAAIGPLALDQHTPATHKLLAAMPAELRTAPSLHVLPAAVDIFLASCDALKAAIARNKQAVAAVDQTPVC